MDIYKGYILSVILPLIIVQSSSKNTALLMSLYLQFGLIGVGLVILILYKVFELDRPPIIMRE